MLALTIYLAHPRTRAAAEVVIPRQTYATLEEVQDQVATIGPVPLALRNADPDGDLDDAWAVHSGGRDLVVVVQGRRAQTVRERRHARRRQRPNRWRH